MKPILSDVDALTLERIWLMGELASMKILVLQGQYRDAMTGLEARRRDLARDGYQLQRTDDGAWSYTADTRPAPAPLALTPR